MKQVERRYLGQMFFVKDGSLRQERGSVKERGGGSDISYIFGRAHYSGEEGGNQIRSRVTGDDIPTSAEN